MRPALIAVFGIFLSGCAGTQSLSSQPSPEQLGNADSRRAVTSINLDQNRQCRQFTKPVKHPDVIGMNGKVAWKAADHALSVANGRLQKADDCMAQQASEYK